MLYVFHNNKSYSDGRFAFVEAPKGHEADFKAWLDACLAVVTEEYGYTPRDWWEQIGTVDGSPLWKEDPPPVGRGRRNITSQRQLMTPADFEEAVTYEMCINGEPPRLLKALTGRP